jgi:D-alanine-D-alanine ligase
MDSATEFGKVAVLMGGNSAEREISLKSGEAVLAALLRQNIDAHKVDVGVNINADMVTGEFDRAFVILHGRGGEDGQIQGVLDSLSIPYSGSSMEGSVLSMNKALSKVIWQQQNLPTAKFERVTQETDLDALTDKLGLPLFIKPVNEGSSIGMTKVNATSELATAINLALEYDSEVIAESWIDGDEYTVGIVAGEALPVIQLVTPNEFYDFDAKYQAVTTQYLCPTNLNASEEAECQSIAKKAFDGVRMSGWGRIDFMRDKAGQFYLLEANSVPGMTDHSLVPMAAKASGLNFDQLVWKILETSMGNNNG